jgi:hypothetical protein
LKELFLAPLGLFTNERGSVNVEFQPWCQEVLEVGR